jgi:hypothetical protein
MGRLRFRSIAEVKSPPSLGLMHARDPLSRRRAVQFTAHAGSLARREVSLLIRRPSSDKSTRINRARITMRTSGSVNGQGLKVGFAGDGREGGGADRRPVTSGRLDEAALSLGAEPVAIAADGQHIAVVQEPVRAGGRAETPDPRIIFAPENGHPNPASDLRLRRCQGAREGQLTACKCPRPRNDIARSGTFSRGR